MGIKDTLSRIVHASPATLPRIDIKTDPQTDALLEQTVDLAAKGDSELAETARMAQGYRRGESFAKVIGHELADGFDMRHAVGGALKGLREGMHQSGKDALVAGVSGFVLGGLGDPAGILDEGKKDK